MNPLNISFALRLWAGAFLLTAGIGIAHAAATFTPKDQPFGTLPPVALSGFNVSTGTQYSFDAWFDPVTWKGDVSAFPIDSSGHTTLNNKRWSAAVQVNAQNYDSGRRIVTRNASGVAVPFRDATPGLSASQVTTIGGTNAVNFIRGDRSNEKQLTTTEGGVTVVVNTGSSATGTFRGRYSVLGDILHAKAAYVGAPPADYVFDSYQTYKSNNSARAGRIYVGANDGMLHSFDASTGDEVFAYIPSMLIGNLSKLTVDPYDHNYYVDGGLTGGDVNFGGSGVGVSPAPDWRTVLVGGLGAGGKGIFALDVSDAAAADETAAKAKILWEITSTTTNFGDLGYTYGDPSIVRVNNGQWAVLVSNGYLSSSGKAVLYVIDVKTGLLIRAIDTGSGSVASPNGLSTPTAIDTNLDGVMDYVYAGDIDGNVWKFNLTSSNPAAWSVTKLHNAEHTPGKAIIGAPEVAAHPTSGYLVYFATGRLFSQTEAADTTAQNYVYSVWDGASVSATTFLGQDISTGTYGGSLPVRVATANVPNWTTANRCDDSPPPALPADCILVVPPHKGWKVPLPVGEHIVSSGFVRDGRYHVVSLNAAQVNTPKPNGANWLMELNHLTGGAPSKLVFDLSGDGLLTDGDRATDADGAPITTSLGIPLGMNIGPGMFSTPTLVLISATLNTTLFNNNPYVSPGNVPDTPPVEESGGRGVAGGHFDVDVYYHANGAKICSFTGSTTTIGIDAQYQIVVTSTGNPYTANVGEISLGGTVIADAFSVTDGTATITNATTLKNAINSKASGYTATSSGNTVTITAPTNSYSAGNGLSFTKVAGSVTAPAGGAPAVGRIVIGTQPASATRITGVTFNSVNILASPVGFPAGSSRSDIASALNAALTNPAGFTRSITTTNVANDTITFTQTTNGGAAPTISVASSAGTIGAVFPTGLVAFGGSGTTNSSSNASISKTLSSNTASLMVDTTKYFTSGSITIGKSKTPAQAAAALANAIMGLSSSTLQAYVGGTPVTSICGAQPATTVCLIDTGSYTNGKSITLGAPNGSGTPNSRWGSVTYQTTGTATAGGIAGTAAVAQPTSTSTSAGSFPAGVDDLAPFLSTSQSRTGQDAGETGGTLVNCPRIKHVHEYDDIYDVTGVNMLNASDSAYNLSNYISNSTQFKIIAHNQYLSPAVTLDIGGSGAVSVKNFGTESTLTVADLPTYTLASSGFTLQFDMPRDAFSHKDWWGNGDDRVGLHPTAYSCAVPSASDKDGQMYQPVIPPATITATGAGTNGWNSGTTPLTATGARHNGSLTIQIIKATTPDSALEMNIPGSPEYGWRVKAADFETHVLVEYMVFWHDPENVCFGNATWTKQNAPDPTSCFTDQIIAGRTGTQAAAACYQTPAAGSSDPGLGTRRALVTGSTTQTTITGSGLSSIKVVTVTISYDDGSTLVVTTTYHASSLNSDGSVRRWTTDSTTTQFTPGTGNGGGPATPGSSGSNLNQASNITSTITGYQQSRNAGKLGRVSWRELLRE
jgi:hypothetical protein